MGVPVSSRELNSDCSILVEKIVMANIKIWSSIHLCFAGKMQLINSVQMSINAYWGQIFIIPNSIIMNIIVVCPTYGYGLCDDSRPRSLGWDKLCNAKGQGLKVILASEICPFGTKK